jgi:hypothetical protein
VVQETRLSSAVELWLTKAPAICDTTSCSMFNDYPVIRGNMVSILTASLNDYLDEVTGSSRRWQLPTKLHGVTSQNIVILALIAKGTSDVER